jgi:hypothetical protein
LILVERARERTVDGGRGRNRKIEEVSEKWLRRDRKGVTMAWLWTLLWKC